MVKIGGRQHARGVHFLVKRDSDLPQICAFVRVYFTGCGHTWGDLSLPALFTIPHKGAHSPQSTFFKKLAQILNLTPITPCNTIFLPKLPENVHTSKIGRRYPLFWLFFVTFTTFAHFLTIFRHFCHFQAIFDKFVTFRPFFANFATFFNFLIILYPYFYT